MKPVQRVRRAIVIGNGIAGAENQCIGLVRALGLTNQCTLYRVTRPTGGINEKLRWLPVSIHRKFDRFVKCIRGDEFLENERPPSRDGKNILQADAKKIAKMTLDTFERDGPVLLVASGRDTIGVATSIKRLAPKNVFLIQIQHPRYFLERFDLVIAPRHDYYHLTPDGQKEIPFFLRWITPRKPPGKNVVLTTGALHQADCVALKNMATLWHDVMVHLPKPLLVVCIGGPSRHCRYGVELAMELMESLNRVLPNCGSIRISFSRRTPKNISDFLVRKLSENPKVYIWNGEDPNPHMGNLAWADAFVITADSVSMLSEACSTGKPVYVIGSEHCKWKLSSFLKSLRSLEAIRPFTVEEKIPIPWHYSPLRDTEMAAAEVVKALAERQWKLATTMNSMSTNI